MMTSANGDIFRVTGHLWKEPTGHWWIPPTKASDAEINVPFDLRLSKRFSKRPRRLRFGTELCSLWCQISRSPIDYSACYKTSQNIFVKFGHLETILVKQNTRYSNYMTHGHSAYKAAMSLIRISINIVLTMLHYDVIKWKHLPRYRPFVRGIHKPLMDFPHKEQWQGALMFSLIYDWTKSWANNRDAGDLGPHCAHYDVGVLRNSPSQQWS